MDFPIARYELYDETSLISRLREVTLESNPGVKIYGDAEIALVTVDPNDLYPAQLYVLREEIAKITVMRDAFLRMGIHPYPVIPLNPPLEKGDFHSFPPLEKGDLGGFVPSREREEEGIDILALQGYVKFWLQNDETSPIDILPPIVEESEEPSGDKLALICDGLHRIYLARKLGCMVNVVFIRGVLKGYPYYAYPNMNGWDDVVELDKLPQGFVKKHYRVKEHRKLFRDFNSVFDSVGRRRKAIL